MIVISFIRFNNIIVNELKYITIKRLHSSKLIN